MPPEWFWYRKDEARLAEKEGVLFPERGRGTYILVLELAAPTTITVGRLGTFPFAAGWYTYVGSAFGAGGLRGRLTHHLQHEKRLHWHVDYLAAQAVLREIWYLASETGYEHVWAAMLKGMPESQIPVGRFGASDCGCASHLFYFRERPVFEVFQGLVVDQLNRQDAKRWSVGFEGG